MLKQLLAAGAIIFSLLVTAGCNDTHQPAPMSASVPRELSAESKTYMSKMGSSVMAICLAIQTLGELSTQAKQNGEVAKQDEWRYQAVIQISVLKSAGEEIQKISPVPAEMAEIDRISKEMGKESVQISQHFGRGADTRNADTRLDVSRRMERLGALADEFKAELERILSQKE